MKRNYKKLGILKFGKLLLNTGDLDPVYIMLWKAKLTPKRLKRWIMAYSMFYHAGVASLLSNYRGKEFWRKAAKLALPESKTPRGSERRHFRGKAAQKSIAYFAKQYPKGPEQAIGYLVGHSKGTVDGVVSLVRKRWPVYGSWVGFKLADLLERLQIAPIRFPIKTLTMYKEPEAGASLAAGRFPKLWSENQDDPPPNTEEVVEHLIKLFKKYKAPPRYERPVNAQEIETILCKWKSHMNGHYPVGKDTIEIREALKGWGNLARKLRKCLP